MPLFTRIRSNTTHFGAARSLACLLGWALISTGLWASDTPALSSSCEQFKTVLVGRMDPSISGYSMETMPANAPVPTGGKVIGTCEGGAIKIVYYRFGAPSPAPISPPIAAKPVNTVAPPVPPPTVAAPANASLAIPTMEAPPTPAKPAVAPVVTVSTEPSPEPAIALEHSWSSQLMGVMAGLWKWLLAFLALALAGGAWAWWMHHNAYDAAGLPRGPRL